MKTYIGTPDRSVLVYPDTGDPYPLPWRLDLWNHSPTGLNWGYGGSGPAQCALALLADHLGDDREAVRLHQPFKWGLIATIPMGQPWELTSDQIDSALATLREAVSNPRPFHPGSRHGLDPGHRSTP